MDFLTEAFEAQELARIANADGSIGHAGARIGDSVVMAFDSRPGWPVTPSLIRLFLADADAVYERSFRAGATSVTTVTELFFGDRVGRVRDPFGNIWWIQAHVRARTVVGQFVWATQRSTGLAIIVIAVGGSGGRGLRRGSPGVCGRASGGPRG